MAEKKKWEQVGSMRAGSEDKGGGYYLKIEKDIPAGSIIKMEKPQDRINRLVEKGVIKPEEGEARIAKVPDYIRFELILPPPRDTEDSNF